MFLSPTLCPCCVCTTVPLNSHELTGIPRGVHSGICANKRRPGTDQLSRNSDSIKTLPMNPVVLSSDSNCQSTIIFTLQWNTKESHRDLASFDLYYGIQQLNTRQLHRLSRHDFRDLSQSIHEVLGYYIELGPDSFPSSFLPVHCSLIIHSCDAT
jgi:hypothetical protein